MCLLLVSYLNASEMKLSLLTDFGFLPEPPLSKPDTPRLERREWPSTADGRYEERYSEWLGKDNYSQSRANRPEESITNRRAATRVRWTLLIYLYLSIGIFFAQDCKLCPC